MVSVSAVAQGTDYYSAEDYYLSEKAEWGGQLSEDLRLTGTASKEEFMLTLSGFSKDGEKLTKNAGSENRRGGYDLTFAPDKSVSIEMHNNDAIRLYHADAVSTAMKFAEEHFAQTRTMTNGLSNYEKTDNLAYTKITHFTNRNAETQLHTHVVVHNLTRDSQGNIKSLSNGLTDQWPQRIRCSISKYSRL